MAQSESAAAQAPPFSGPGLIYTTSRPFAAELSDERFNEWYSRVHMTDALATGGPQRASRWKCADGSVTPPYLALYKVKDLATLQSEEFKKIPMTHESLPAGPGGKHSIFESIDFDTRIYSLVELFEKEKHDDNFGTHIISAGMQPATRAASDDMERWYVDEHNEQMSLEPGYIRSSRYRLVHHIKREDSHQHPKAPEWMTIHEFGEGNKLGTKVTPLDPISDWTKKVMGDMSGIEAYVWKKFYETTA